MRINRNTSFIRWLVGFFGGGGPADTTSALPQQSGQKAGLGMGGSSQQVAGQAMRQQIVPVPTGRGFEASVSFSYSKQRPPTVGSHVVEYDPTSLCEGLKSNPIQYSVCVQNALAAPPVDYTQFSSTTAGGSFFRVPPQTSINWRAGFDLTPKWAVQWNTSYDAVRHEFASHQVTLQRDLHDWRAMFGFTQAPNGNFSFTFYVSLKAEPDLKFNYDRASYRSSFVQNP